MSYLRLKMFVLLSSIIVLGNNLNVYADNDREHHEHHQNNDHAARIQNKNFSHEWNHQPRDGEHREFYRRNRSTQFYYTAPVISNETYYFPANDDSYSNYYPTTTIPDTTIYNQTSNDDDQSYPSGNWINASNGQIPPNAIPYKNDMTIFYCRGIYNNQIIYGLAKAQEGCYSKDNLSNTSVHLDVYQILTQ